MAWNAIEQLNKNAKKAAVRDNTPKAHFRTQDVSINKMYSNDKNFYSVEDIEPLAQKILLVGLIENLEVVRDPCDRGEYRIVAGERRWRALKMLVEKGYTEFEKATCQIQTPASEDEETLHLIIANDYRSKTVADILEEEDRLKKTLQRMKEKGLTIMGIDLNSGRLRDVIADFLKMPPTKVAQIESINKHLIPEFSKELKEGRLTFSAAYMISGMSEEAQAETLARYQENGLTYKEVKEIKQQQEEKAAAEQIESQMELDMEDQFTEVEDEWEDAHPESITSLEERYSEEQDRIDRETAKKLREKADEEKMQQLHSQQGKKVHDVKLGATFFEDVKTGRKTFELRKNDREYKEGDTIVLHEYKDGATTGRTITKKIVYMLEDFTGLEDGYCILGLGAVEETLQEAAAGAGQDADNRTLEYGA